MFVFNCTELPIHVHAVLFTVCHGAIENLILSSLVTCGPQNIRML